MMACSPFKATEAAMFTKGTMVSLIDAEITIQVMVASKEGLAQIGVGANHIRIIVIMIMIRIFLQTTLQLEELEGAMALVVQGALVHVGVRLLPRI